MKRFAVVALLALASPALAQAQTQAQEPVINLHLPKSQADLLERILGDMKTRDVGVLYFTIQNQILEQGQAEVAKARDDFARRVIAEDKAKTAPPVTPPTTDKTLPLPPPEPAPAPTEQPQ